MSALQQEEQNYPDRWTLIRDMAVLQVKLIVDGFREGVRQG